MKNEHKCKTVRNNIHKKALGGNEMKYIYTSNQCPKCTNLKDGYNRFGILFVERPADRIKSPEDDIDIQALIQASMQNMQLPVEVEV